jgi:hypothetical protein
MTREILFVIRKQLFTNTACVRQYSAYKLASLLCKEPHAGSEMKLRGKAQGSDNALPDRGRRAHRGLR